MGGTERAFLGLFGAGLACLLAGWGLIRQHWDPALGRFSRGSRTIAPLLRPAAYVKDAPLGLIRALTSAGALLLTAAAGVVVHEILRVMHVV